MSDKAPHTPLDDAQNLLKTFWDSLKLPLPGMVAPTLDVDELDKRINDMKAVEGWLKMNLNMLQSSIQALEVQKLTITAMKQAMAQAQSASDGDGQNPFAQAALWPWTLMQGMQEAAQRPPEGGESNSNGKKEGSTPDPAQDAAASPKSSTTGRGNGSKARKDV